LVIASDFGGIRVVAVDIEVIVVVVDIIDLVVGLNQNYTVGLVVVMLNRGMVMFVMQIGHHLIEFLVDLDHWS